jgi:hypothetical protein
MSANSRRVGPGERKNKPVKKEPNIGIESYRRIHPILGESTAGANWGFFMVGQLAVIASDGLGWDHVSVSRRDRLPTWDEMVKIKNLWFDEEETVVQFHPKKSEYVNCCGKCLHLWRKQGHEYELPTSSMIGPLKKEGLAG